jgi:Tfp pilus assembly protein PilN
MINLLPPIKKQELAREKNWKISLILSINLIAVVVCFCLILLFINILLSVKIDFQEIVYQQSEKQFSSPKIQTLSDNLKTLNQTFFRLDSFYQKQFRATKTLEEISANVPAQIVLTNLLINPKEKDKTIECVLTGFAPTREVLLKFKDGLEGNQDFQEIYFPTSSWIKSTDINFTVNFKMKWQ